MNNRMYLPAPSNGFQDSVGRTFTVTEDGRTMHNGMPFTGIMHTTSPNGTRLCSTSFSDGWPVHRQLNDGERVRTFVFSPPGQFLKQTSRAVTSKS
jgi:hypothetical protein